MIRDLHLLCMSCGEQFSEIPVSTKNCPKCNEQYRNRYKNKICRRYNCTNKVLNQDYPLCIKCYKEVLALDKKMVEDFYHWANK